MHLKNTGITILSQLASLIEQLTAEQYSSPISLLNDNTIGKHVRHILEFFIVLEEGQKTGVINYDKRPHDTLFETDKPATLKRISLLMKSMDEMALEKQAILEVSYVADASETEKIPSSLQRELAYNIEHAIHHMAIIKIAVKSSFSQVYMPANFGVAYSTLRFLGETIHG